MRAYLVLVLLAGCEVTGEFHCETSEQCVQSGAQGVCVSGSCAFSDEACASGWRYANSAQEDVAGSCLDGDAPAGCETWTPKHFTACALPAPLGPIQLSQGYVYDTDHGEFLGGAKIDHASIVTAQPDGTPARVISASAFSLAANVRLRVIGSLPLIVASWGDIVVAGGIEVDSTFGALVGAGANPAACGATTAKQGEAGVASKGSGGGGGGAFGGAGGAGGHADADNAMPRQGGAGGMAVAMKAATVRGGCAGAPGGAIGPGAAAPLTAALVAPGGAGGGAIQLTARGKITLTAGAFIEAGGSGGAGGAGNEAGGGGGGSGGFIGLEGTMILLSSGSIVAANGGGGGGGAADTAPGGNGTSATVNNNAAGGGAGAGAGTGGGAGAAGATLAGANVDDPDNLAAAGGGGGGGGAGVIVVRGAVTMTGAQVSPAVTVDP